MTKKEIQEAKNDDLILALSTAMASYRVTKKSTKMVEQICEELQERGVVSEDFKNEYMKIYMT